MEEKNIKHSLLYVSCFVIAALEVVGQLFYVAYMNDRHRNGIFTTILLILLALSSYYLYALWKPALAGVNYFLAVKGLALVIALVYFCIEGFEPWIISLHVLLILVLIMRAYYKLLLTMPFEY